MRRRALVIGATLLTLVAAWVAVLRAPTHPDTLTAGVVTTLPTDQATTSSDPSATQLAAPDPASTGDGFSAVPDPSLTPTPVGGTTPAPAPSSAGAGTPSSSTSSSPPAKPSPTPTASSTPRAVVYVFAPKAGATGPAPSEELRFSDLALTPGEQIVSTFTMTSPGAIVFDAHTATSSVGTGTYPVAGLHACVEFVGQAPCRPVAVPQPGYWSVTAKDLAKHHDYRLRVQATVTSSLFAGIHVGWRGPGRLVVNGIRLPGGCQATVGKGYVAGCGLKYKVIARGSEQLSVSTSTGGLQLSLKNTVTNAKLYSGPLSSPQRIQIPAAGDWSGHLYPSAGNPVRDFTFTMAWH